MLNNVDLGKIEARYIEKGVRKFYLVWKGKPYPHNFICNATPHSVSKRLKCSKVEAFKLIKAKLKAFQRQVERQVRERKEVIRLIDKRLKFYKQQAYKDVKKYQICKKCGSVFQIPYNSPRVLCDKCEW